MRLAAKLIVVSSLGLTLAGCSVFDTRSTKPAVTTSKGGGYYKDDGPGDNPPADLAAIPDAVPKLEPPHRGASRPYTALGRDYVPMADGRGYKERGLASWYGRRYHGKPTSMGEPYDMYAMTAAHPTLPLPSYVRVSNPANGRSVVVRVNDRGPFHEGRIIDLSYTAAWKLDLLRGVSPVDVEHIDPTDPLPAVAATGPVATPQAFTTPAPAAAPGTVAPPQAGATVAAVTTAPLPPLPQERPLPGAGAALPKPDHPTAPAGTAAYLQLGAFANPDSAERLVRQMHDRLGDRLPGVHRLEAGGLIKVQVGPYHNPLLADLAALALERETGVKPLRVLR